MVFPSGELFFAALLLTAGITAANIAIAQSYEPLSPLPTNLRLDGKKIALGSKLFRDTRFAKDNSVACISCHNFQHGGADPRPLSIGAGGIEHVINTPSIFNVGFNFRQQWSGGVDSLEQLVGKLVKNPRVFNSNWKEIIGKLSKDEQFILAFNNSYPEGMTAETISDSLAVYQRSLITPSRFDRYLHGDVNAISEDEKHGYERFKAYGCVGCHQGVNIGGNMFQKFGAMGDYFAARTAAGYPVREADKGRYNVTRREEDMFLFKVPSLRNVENTAPYFHDGSVATLEGAVEVMFRFQLGRIAPLEDKALIVKFLKSLTGENITD
ncbi:MAG: cytochrome c peroxidase [Pseudomonadota bacterium]